jgi:hypothetical protein
VTSPCRTRHAIAQARSPRVDALRFVDAYGIVGTACAILAAGRETQLPDLRLPAAATTQRHLDSMGLTRFLKQSGYPYDVEPEPIDSPDVLVPLTPITTIHDAEQLSHLLVEQIEGEASAEVIEPLTEGLWELVANALEPSGEQAMLMGQVYTNGQPPFHDGHVQIAVGDIGHGIRQSFLRSGTRTPTSDHAAIKLALEYLVSSIPDKGRGQGLWTTLEGVTAMDGTLVVRTGGARVATSRAGSKAAVVPELPGTLVGISLPLYPYRS